MRSGLGSSRNRMAVDMVTGSLEVEPVEEEVWQKGAEPRAGRAHPPYPQPALHTPADQASASEKPPTRLIHPRPPTQFPWQRPPPHPQSQEMAFTPQRDSQPVSGHTAEATASWGQESHPPPPDPQGAGCTCQHALFGCPTDRSRTCPSSTTTLSPPSGVDPHGLLSNRKSPVMARSR